MVDIHRSVREEEVIKERFTQNITNIDQQHRGNSCLENHNKQLQEAILCNATWADLVEGLRNKEERVYQELIEKEKKGESFQSSLNFSKKFILSWAHTALSKAKKSQIPNYLPQKHSNDSVNQIFKLPPTVGLSTTSNHLYTEKD